MSPPKNKTSFFAAFPIAQRFGVHYDHCVGRSVHQQLVKINAHILITPYYSTDLATAWLPNIFTLEFLKIIIGK